MMTRKEGLTLSIRGGDVVCATTPTGRDMYGFGKLVHQGVMVIAQKRRCMRVCESDGRRAGKMVMA